MNIQKTAASVCSSIGQQSTRQRLINSVCGTPHQQHLKNKQISKLIGALKEIQAQKEEEIIDILCPQQESVLTKIKNKAIEIISLF